MEIPTKSGVRALAVLALAALSLLAGAAQASARTVPVYTYTGQYYDGTGSTAGTLAYPSDLDLNQTAEKGYLTDPARLGGSVSQFDGDGNPLAFSALEGATAIPLHLEAAERVAVDNSSMSSHGNIYALAENVVKGFRPDGTEIRGGFPLGGFQKICDIAVDAEGDLWVVNYSSSKILEYNALGESTGKTISYKPFTTGLLQRGLQPLVRLRRQLLLRHLRLPQRGRKRLREKIRFGRACPVLVRGQRGDDLEPDDGHDDQPCVHAGVEALRRRIRADGDRVRRERRSDHLIRDSGSGAFLRSASKGRPEWPSPPATNGSTSQTSATSAGRSTSRSSKRPGRRRCPPSRPNPRR